MLSIVPLKDAGAAKTYYEKDNYYVKDAPELIAASCWHGKGAALLSLEGVIEKPAFEAILAGRLPTGVQLGRIENGKLKHRPGYDLTFSAPKSVSILSEVMGDNRLHNAHDQAVKEARALMAEDRIRWTKNHTGHVNGRMADVVSINQIQATIRLHNGKMHTMDLQSHQHWDYAFALTTHAAQ